MKKIELNGNYIEWKVLSELVKFMNKLDKEDKLIFKSGFMDERANRYAGLFENKNNGIIEKTIRASILIDNDNVKISIYNYSKDLAVCTDFTIIENSNMYTEQIKMAVNLITKYKNRYDKQIIEDVLSLI